MASFWAKIKSVLGMGGKPQEQRMALPQKDRWSRMLKALQVSRAALMPALERELERGLDSSERMLAPAKEKLFFDGLMVGRLSEALDILCMELDPDAVTEHVMGKIPSLRDWAIGSLTGESLTRKSNPEMIAWARDAGKLKKGVLREALLAEAIECGRSEMAKRELSDAGLEQLDAAQMQSFMEAFAQRKEAGLSEGLDSSGLEAFAQAMGGWASAIEAAAGLGHEELMNLIDDLLEAVREDDLIEAKVFEKAKQHSTKKVREIIAKAVAAQAAKSDRPVAMRSAIAAGADASGFSTEKVARSKVQGARVKVGAMEVKSGVEGGLSLYEIAKLSGAKGVQKALEEIYPSSSKIAAQRMVEIVEDTEKSVRFLVMRASGSEREATKAWRETVKDWKNGLLGGVDLAQMQALVDNKVSQAVQTPSSGKPKM